ncbi:hypothetical protein B0T14DRAFT_512041 [Immersiella caudata]|uniref:MADS-box domain-containing protein n=1 Tax=Immersiella caudata TaxID=314043 RepID=A0AA39X4L5_9PEZI|nr:hypothetical protein B0T14DRAFT_512041 [Immersiella caudata]
MRPTATAAAKSEAKRQSTKAFKRRKTLTKKAHEFYMDCGFEILLLLQKGSGRSYIYTSSGIPSSWHPIVEGLKQTYPLPIVYTPVTLAKEQSQKVLASS